MFRTVTFRAAVLTTAFALAVYGATAQLAHVVDDIVLSMQSPSAPWPDSLWLLWLPTLPLVAIAFVSYFAVWFGGLPIALMAIVLHTIGRNRGRWSKVLESHYYGCFIFQVLSTAFTAFWLLVTFPGNEVEFFDIYLRLQLAAGIVALPLWRHLLERASRDRIDARVLQLAG